MSKLTSAVARHGSTPWPIYTIFGSALLVVFGLGVQAGTHLNHDISWILYSAGQMLHGAEFGRDVIPVNPPLAWFLALIPVGIAEQAALDPVAVFRIFTAATLVATLAFVLWYLRAEDIQLNEAGLTLLSLATAYVLFVGCYRDFGQREHLAFAYSLPYILLAAGRMDGRSYPLAISIPVGLAAGLGLALKPYFLAVPLLVELLGVLRTRSLYFPFRSETIALAGFMVVYLASVFVLTPAYVFDIVPMVRPIYWGFNNDIGLVLYSIRFELFGFAVAVFLALNMWAKGQSLQWVLLAAAAGFLFSYLVQAKGYTYHGQPFRGLLLMLLAMQWASLIARAGPGEASGETPGEAKARIASPFVVFIALLAVFSSNAFTAMVWFSIDNRVTGRRAAQIDDLIDLANRHAAGDRFLALSTHPFPGFPTAVYSTSEWASRTNSIFFIPVVARLRHLGEASPHFRDGTLRYAEEKAHSFLLRDLAFSPRLVLVDARPIRHAIGDLTFDILAFYLEEPRIREIWSRYRELEPVHGFRVFLLRDPDVAG